MISQAPGGVGSDGTSLKHVRHFIHWCPKNSAETKAEVRKLECSQEQVIENSIKKIKTETCLFT